MTGKTSDAVGAGTVVPADQQSSALSELSALPEWALPERAALPERKPDRPHVAGGHATATSAPVPVPGTPPGSHVPGVQAAAAVSRDGRIVAITRLANAVPGKPDGEVDTRPLLPLWGQTPTPT
jgi:hypothetical protein